MISLARLFTPLCLALLTALPANALTIDAFVDDGYVSSTSTVSTTKTAYVPSALAIGGGRTLSATKSGSGTGVTRLEVVDSSLGYTQGAHAGYASITWDGDNDPTTLKPNGLGSIDLTQDGGTALKIGVMFFDYPTNQPVQVKVRLYDASTPDGTKFSESSISLNQFHGGPGIWDISIPFSRFPNVDVTRVGAISMSFRGDLNSRAPDIILAPFTTNGRCSAVPDASGRAIDECGVCHEHADAKKGTDRCGICLAGPNGYSYASNKIFDSCSLCPGESRYQFPDGIKDKCGTCLNGPAPYTYVDKRDVCGVCGGKTTKKDNCTIGSNGCPLVKPNEKILGFEKRLVEKATLLKSRYLADVRRAKVRKCPLSFNEATKRVASAFNKIETKSAQVFRQGIEVCADSCITVSYAEDVKALTPQFKILEVEATTAAKLVQKCYQQLRVPVQSGGDGVSRTSQTVTSVRNGLNNLLRECQQTSVCKKK